MDTLPIDVFQEILEHIIRHPSFGDEWPIPDEELRAVCPLIGTCRRWRDVMFQTPSIWTYIQVNGDIDERHLVYIRTRLKRSGDAPLDICLRNFEDQTTTSSFLLPTCFRAISKQRHRIRRLLYSPAGLDGEVLELFTRPCPLLEELLLMPFGGRHEELLNTQLDTTCQYFSNTPKLRHIESHLACMIPAQALSMLTFLSISMRDVPHDILWLTLPHTPFLEELAMYFPENGWQPNESNQFKDDLSLPNLVRLQIYGYPAHFNWAEKLDVPRLTTLTVSVEYVNESSELYRALGDKIRHLVITTVEPVSGGFLDDTDMMAVDSIKSLSSLELRDIPEQMASTSNQSFFEYLATCVNDSDDGSIWSARCPKLIFRRCRFDWRACQGLVTFVSARNEAAAAHGRPMLQLEFDDTVFVRYGDVELRNYEQVANQFLEARFEEEEEEVSFHSAESSNHGDWDDWSNASEDGGVIGHLFEPKVVNEGDWDSWSSSQDGGIIAGLFDADEVEVEGGDTDELPPVATNSAVDEVDEEPQQ